MRVLYVEGSPTRQMDADLIDQSLSGLSTRFVLETADTEAQAVSLIEEDPSSYDVILLESRPHGSKMPSLLDHIRGRSLPLPVVMLIESNHEERAPAALRAGAHDFLIKRGDYLEELPLRLECALVRQRGSAGVGESNDEIVSGYNSGEIIGESEVLRQSERKASQVAATDATVLILGETGTGKEMFARAIHSLSLRRNRPMVKVNCAALPADLIESELFGHARGAFTGAHSSRLGRFETADGATIFLDEIGELPMDLQAKLLRVLQDGEFERIGSSRTIKVDVRVIAATNRDMESAVRHGAFRADLYYRLHVFPIAVPPLRERLDDIPLLVSHFVKLTSQRLGKRIETIPPDLMETLQRYSWPGNVRELQNVIERAVITTPGARLRLADSLGIHDFQSQNNDGPHPAHVGSRLVARNVTLAEVVRDYIVSILEKTYWRIEGKNGAAEILGINPNTLRFRMRKLGIQRPTFRD
jgi:transcriptional regulator with GAF, ATPase, and Fis domain